MDIQEKVTICGKFAGEKKAKNVIIMELTGLTDITDYFVITSGTSERHVRTITEHIETCMKKLGIRPYSIEGYNEGRWVILDFQNLVVHVFLESLRELYDLESLWIEAKTYRLENR